MRRQTLSRCLEPGSKSGARLQHSSKDPDVVYVPSRNLARSFKGVDIALFSAGGSISKTLGPVAAAAGCVVSKQGSTRLLLAML